MYMYSIYVCSFTSAPQHREQTAFQPQGPEHPELRFTVKTMYAVSQQQDALKQISIMMQEHRRGGESDFMPSLKPSRAAESGGFRKSISTFRKPPSTLVSKTGPVAATCLRVSSPCTDTQQARPESQPPAIVSQTRTCIQSKEGEDIDNYLAPDEAHEKMFGDVRSELSPTITHQPGQVTNSSARAAVPGAPSPASTSDSARSSPLASDDIDSSSSRATDSLPHGETDLRDRDVRERQARNF